MPENIIYTEAETKEMCKKTIWDYIFNNMPDTDFHMGVSISFKSHKETNIDNWFDKNKKTK